ncbi:MAG TPA: ATP phosphoribosyltransferase regulatory subunit [Candidatus Humimicrobiaceae bacterium]
MFKENEENLTLMLPFGFRDIFPVEAQERKDIDEVLRNEFISWGYGEVKTPIIEYTKNISAGAGAKWKDKLISFFDIDGNIVSFRADMTVPIARLSGMRIKERQLPARFFYFANSFRQSGPQKGQKRFLNQAGIEFIGAEGISADLEILNILINLLGKSGLKDFKIAIGHVGFFEGIAGWFGLDKEGYETVKENLINKDYVALKQYLAAIDSAKAGVFMDMIKPVKDFKGIEGLCKDITDKKVSGSIDYLKQVCCVLDGLGFAENIILDLSIMRDFGYYSGLIFEIYTPDIFEMIGSGGRYDGLLKKFGLDVPATGFAIDVDILHKALAGFISGKRKSINKIILNVESTDYLRTLKLAEKLKNGGSNIVELIFGFDRDLENLSLEKKADFIFRPDFKSNTVLISDLKNNTTQSKKIDDII